MATFNKGDKVRILPSTGTRITHYLEVGSTGTVEIATSDATGNVYVEGTDAEGRKRYNYVHASELEKVVVPVTSSNLPELPETKLQGRSATGGARVLIVEQQNVDPSLKEDKIQVNLPGLYVQVGEGLTDDEEVFLPEAEARKLAQLLADRYLAKDAPLGSFTIGCDYEDGSYLAAEATDGDLFIKVVGETPGDPEEGEPKAGGVQFKADTIPALVDALTELANNITNGVVYNAETDGS